MKVYVTQASSNHTIHVQPGHEFKDVSDWVDAQGHPILLSVKFNNGVADVESNLGKYLIDKGLAKKSRLILPH
jgi:hypothetical protein